MKPRRAQHRASRRAGASAHKPGPPRALRQRGAALLTAMLTVALVATLASAALWQQWRQVEIEIA